MLGTRRLTLGVRHNDSGASLGRARGLGTGYDWIINVATIGTTAGEGTGLAPTVGSGNTATLGTTAGTGTPYNFDAVLLVASIPTASGQTTTYNWSNSEEATLGGASGTGTAHQIDPQEEGSLGTTAGTGTTYNLDVQEQSDVPAASGTGTSYNWSVSQPSGPTPEMVTFDGTNDYWTRGAALTGEGNTSTISVYAKFNTSAVGNNYLFHMDGNYWRLYQTGTNFYIQIKNTTGTAIYEITTTGVTVNDGSDKELFLSFNGSTGAGQCYIGGTDVEPGSPTAETTGTIEFTRPDYAVGGTTSGTATWDGDLERFTIWDDVALDVSSSTVRADMADTAEASNLGTAIIDLYGAPADWNNGDNQGTGGDGTMNGTVV